MNVPEEVAFFIGKRIRSNVRELEGGPLGRVIANSRFTGHLITVEFTKEALKHLLSLRMWPSECPHLAALGQSDYRTDSDPEADINDSRERPSRLR